MRKLLTPFKAAMVCLVLLTFGQLSAQPCATPDSVTANPSVLCAGGTANLRAVSAGNNISWYTVPVGGVAIGTVGSGANFAVTPGVTTTYYAEAIGTGGNGSQTFNFTGALQLFTVPSGVTSVVVNASGAQGGLGGGQGAAITGTFAVTPGEVLSVIVGGQGAATPMETVVAVADRLSGRIPARS